MTARRLEQGVQQIPTCSGLHSLDVRLAIEHPSYPNGIKLEKPKTGIYSKFIYSQFNNFAISTLFRT